MPDSVLPIAGRTRHGPDQRQPGSGRQASLRFLLLGLVLLLSLGAVFSTQLLTHFDRLTGDRLDGLIQVSIFEHWFNVLRGRAEWDATNYFYPHRGTLAYNDGYLLYGLAYSGLRALGVDPFASAEGVNVLLRVVGFGTAYALARSLLRLPFAWATLGAALFTLTASVYQQSAHAQILSVALAPGAVLLTVKTGAALEAGRARAALAWGAAFAGLISAWLLTAFYMVWLLGLFALFLALFALLDGGARQHALTTLRREWPAILGIALMSALAALPFLSLYLPKARESGMHGFAALRPYLPHLSDTFRVGPGNILFGWSDRFLGQLDASASTERGVGWPPVQLACFLLAAWSLRRNLAARAAVLAVCAIYALSLSIGGVSGWWLIYHLVPGAKAIRVIARAWIMLAGPMLCVALLWLRGLGTARPGLAAALAALLVVEQVSVGPGPALLDRPGELERLQSVLPPPAGCRAFFVTSARTDDPESNKTLQTLSANDNAMLIAEVAGLPTINGESTFKPPDWNFADPADPSYIQRAESYAAGHGLDGMCGLDLRTRRWHSDLAGYRPLHLVPTGSTLPLHGDEAGAQFLGTGWHGPEAFDMRWGGPRATLRFLPQGGHGALRLTVWALAYQRSAAQPQHVSVFANGRLAAVWAMTTTPAPYQVVLQPPGDSNDAFEVTFVSEDPVRPSDVIASQDNRLLGMGLVTVRLDWLSGGQSASK